MKHKNNYGEPLATDSVLLCRIFLLKIVTNKTMFYFNTLFYLSFNRLTISFNGFIKHEEDILLKPKKNNVSGCLIRVIISSFIVLLHTN